MTKIQKCIYNKQSISCLPSLGFSLMVFPFPHPFLGHVSCVPFVHISSFHCFPSLLFLFHPTPPPFLILRAPFPLFLHFFPFSTFNSHSHFPSNNIYFHVQLQRISNTIQYTISQKKDTQSRFIGAACMVINTTGILPIQHGCEIPKSAAILSETCSATELAMQHTIRSQICTSSCSFLFTHILFLYRKKPPSPLSITCRRLQITRGVDVPEKEKKRDKRIKEKIM